MLRLLVKSSVICERVAKLCLKMRKMQLTPPNLVQGWWLSDPLSEDLHQWNNLLLSLLIVSKLRWEGSFQGRFGVSELLHRCLEVEYPKLPLVLGKELWKQFGPADMKRHWLYRRVVAQPAFCLQNQWSRKKSCMPYGSSPEDPQPIWKNKDPNQQHRSDGLLNVILCVQKR